MSSEKINLENTIWLSLPELQKDVIAEYIKRAEKAKVKKLHFIFGDITQVKFTIDL